MNVSKVFCFLVSQAFLPLLYCSDWSAPGGRQYGMGQCAVASTNIWSVTNNQAGMAFVNKSGVALSHSRPFMIKELAANSLVAITPLPNAAMGVELKYAGFKNYNQSKIGISYANKLGQNIAAGLQLAILNQRVALSDKSKQFLSFSLGLIAKLNSQLILGFNISNPLVLKWQTNIESPLPAVAKLGFAYFINANLNIAAETNTSLTEKTIYRIGAEYISLNALALRMGLSSGPEKYSFGLGYVYKKCDVGIAWGHHPVLGFSPVAELTFNW